MARPDVTHELRFRPPVDSLWHLTQSASSILDADEFDGHTGSMSTRLEHIAADADMSVAVELDSDDPVELLRALKHADQQLDTWLRQYVAAARERGVSWSAIGEALGMTKQAAWEYYNADIRTILDRTASASQLSDDEAMKIAVDEVRTVRRERRAG